MILRHFYTATFIFCISVACNKKTESIYKDKDRTPEERVEDLLKKMSLKDKISQLYGHGLSTDANDSLGIPGFLMTDGSNGVRTEQATSFGAGVSLAATWDTLLAVKVAKAIAEEVKGKGLNMLLGPCVNPHRLPSGGRNFESYSEDVYLSARMGVNFIKAIQNENVVACVKHYAGNEQEWERNNVNSVIDERSLREAYLYPFEAAVKEAGVLSVMSAYNKINGSYASENKYLLTDILKNDWKFKGFVVSDWDATHSTVESAINGLDVEMPQPVYFGEKLMEAVKAGKVSEEQINDKVRRILYAKFKAGLFDNQPKPDSSLVNSTDHQNIALEVARKSIVLLKNENSILPIDKSKIKSIAIIGPNAKVARTSGGGSATVIPYYSVSPFEGLEKKLGKEVTINYALGDELDIKGVAGIGPEFFYTSEDKSTPGLKAEFFNNIDLKGEPVLTRVDKNIDFNFLDGSPAPGINKDNFGIRWSGVLISPVPKKYMISTFSDDGVRLFIDGKKVIENWDFHGTEKDSVEIFLDQNTPHKVVLEYFDGQMGAGIKLAWDHGAEAKKSNEQLIKEAVEAAKKSDIAIIFAGLSSQYESEGRDVDPVLAYPKNQDKLISAVLKANPKTIVVKYGGVGIIPGEWINKVPGFIDALYPGQEGGNAIAEILLGETNPSGKLPFTYLKKKTDSPAYKGYMDPSLNAVYSEGIYIGYKFYEKNNIDVLFPFGYGLSYSNFEYSDLKVNKTGRNTFEVNVTVKNTGSVAGEEIAQLYVKPINPKIDRPFKELKGFGKVGLNGGEAKTIKFTLSDKAFAYFDTASKKWKVDQGEAEIVVGSSSKDVKGSIKITLE